MLDQIWNQIAILKQNYIKNERKILDKMVVVTKKFHNKNDRIVLFDFYSSDMLQASLIDL